MHRCAPASAPATPWRRHDGCADVGGDGNLRNYGCQETRFAALVSVVPGIELTPENPIPNASHFESRICSAGERKKPERGSKDRARFLRKRVHRQKDADLKRHQHLSTGERIAVALVSDRYDLVQHAWGSMLKAVHHLGPEWTQVALQVQRNGWLDET
jgi:hypothetical protein